MTTTRSVAEEPLHAPRHRRRAAADPNGAWLHAALLSSLALLGMAACCEPMPTATPRPAALRDAPALVEPRSTAARISVASSTGAPSPALRNFKAYALNTLLLPLLDDDLPSRWADPSQSLDCTDGQVTIDGHRLDVGAPVPREAFVVRWHLQECGSPDGYFELTGDVELRVEPRSGGDTAQVRPAGLQLVSQYGPDRLDESFDARLNVAP